MNVNELCGQRLKALRNEKKLSQDEVAKGVGITRTTLTHYERGTRTMNIEILNSFARYFEVPGDYLTGLIDVRSLDTKTRTFCSLTGLSERSFDRLLFYNACKEQEENGNLQSTYHKGVFYIDIIDNLISHLPVEFLADVATLNFKSSFLVEKKLYAHTDKAKEQLIRTFDSNSNYGYSWGANVVAQTLIESRKTWKKTFEAETDNLKYSNMSIAEIADDYDEKCDVLYFRLLRKFEKILKQYDKRKSIEKMDKTSFLQYMEISEDEIEFAKQEIKSLIKDIENEAMNHVQHPQTNE